LDWHATTDCYFSILIFIFDASPLTEIRSDLGKEINNSKKATIEKDGKVYRRNSRIVGVHMLSLDISNRYF